MSRNPWYKICIILLLLVGTSCSANSASTNVKVSSTLNLQQQKCEAIRAKHTQITIGFSMDTLLEERWQRDRALFQEAIEKLGARVVISAANGDDALQINQTEKLINACVDLLVIVPHNAEATASIIKKAHRVGIKVIAYDRLIKNADIDLYVSFDNEQVGILQAQAITNLVPKGRYVYIGGADTDNNAYLFKKGVMKVLQPLINRGDVQIVYDQWTKDWKPANAQQQMLEALRVNNGKIDAIIAANDATAGGVIEALRIYGLAGKIPVAGQDAELAAIRRIVAGTQTMTVYKPIRSLAEEAAKLAVAMARNEPVRAMRQINNGKIEVPAVLLSPIAVNRGNLEQTIFADGFHAPEDVYRK